LSVSPRTEWEFVLHTARLYERMGCDVLALNLGMLAFFTTRRYLFANSHAF
jgi:RAVE protein 1 C terminal